LRHFPLSFDQNGGGRTPFLRAFRLGAQRANSRFGVPNSNIRAPHISMKRL
jgi:hypothetical protein